MSDVLPCAGCGAAVVEWPINDYSATLTGDPTFPYFLICPPGANCFTDPGGNATNDGTLYFDCFGHLLSASYHTGANLNILMAALLAQCQSDHGGEGPNPETSTGPLWPVTVPLYFSPEVNGTIDCPDGNTFTFTLPAGKFADRTLAKATKAAQDYAKQQAIAHRVCLGSLSKSELPINIPATVTLTATGSTVAVAGNTWAVISGALPTGLALSGTGPILTISGTPTVAGLFTFKLKITTPSGDSMSKTFTICVVEIVNTSPLPDGTVLTPYTQTLTATACATAPLSWQVSAGALPPGLTLDEPTGIISGTPTTAGVYNFTILLQTSAT
jgi:hypothetical protein